ncbi:MAG TPA: histidine--tRNA ligase, partial [Actinomycetota bacterium]|nr:histidine--tRNA ligase [Actinomycetota bacterium]
MEPVNTKPPSGMRDFFPGELDARREVLSKVRDVFESYGFGPLDTPALERLEILQGKYGEEGDRLIFKVMKRGDAAPGDADLALRYDLTVPLARVVAEYQGRIGRIFKRYQIAPVWRADRPGRGRFREFYQCDVDVVGPAFGLADAEVLLALTEALAAVGLKGFEVRLNSRKVLRGLIEVYGIDEAKETGVLTALDKVDRVGWDGVVEELVRDRGLDPATAVSLTDPLRSGADDELRGRLRSSEVGGTGLDEVDRVIDLVGPLLADGRIVFSPSLARGLGYYTGPIFEIFVEGSPSAISSGGRYDGLVGMFAGRSIPAVGGSLGIERIIPLVTGADEGSVASPARVLVTVWDPGFRAEALATAGELRGRGIAAEVYLGEDKLGEQLGYASSRGIPLAVIRGAREREQGVVTVRDLRTREQAAVPPEDLAAY